jgi:hypothetical protein
MNRQDPSLPLANHGWQVFFPEAVIDAADDKINALPDAASRRIWRDLMGRYIRDVEEFPHHRLGWPPRRTEHPSIWRFPAAKGSKVTGWAVLDAKAKTIVIGSILLHFEEKS